MNRRTLLSLVVLGILGLLLLKIYYPDHATWYGQNFSGNRMANGGYFNPYGLTAATWDFPIGSQLLVTYGAKSVAVTVTDHTGKRHLLHFGRTLDLSEWAFSRLANPSVGSIKVKIFQIK